MKTMKWSHGQYGHFACSSLVPTYKKARVSIQNVGIQIVYHNVHFWSNVRFLKSMGKLFPHLVGVFCTIPNPPKSNIMQKIDFLQYLAIFHIIPTIPIIPLRDNRDATVQINFTCTKSGEGLQLFWASQHCTLCSSTLVMPAWLPVLVIIDDSIGL